MNKSTKQSSCSKSWPRKPPAPLAVGGPPSEGGMIRLEALVELISIRAFRVLCLVGSRQTIIYRAIRAESISISSIIPPSYSCGWAPVSRKKGGGLGRLGAFEPCGFRGCRASGLWGLRAVGPPRVLRSSLRKGAPTRLDKAWAETLSGAPCCANGASGRPPISVSGPHVSFKHTERSGAWTGLRYSMLPHVRATLNNQLFHAMAQASHIPASTSTFRPEITSPRSSWRRR